MTVLNVKKVKADTSAGLKLPIGPMPQACVPAVRSTSPAPAKSQSEGEKAETQKRTEVALSPSLGAAFAVLNLTRIQGDLGVVEATNFLKLDGLKAAGGDLAKLQQMLAIQSSTLGIIFNDFLVKASMQTNFDIKEKYIRLALKAQSQCRATVESLAVIQQGPAIFARQANIANGPQQVNNAAPDQLITTLKPEPMMAARVVNKE